MKEEKILMNYYLVNKEGCTMKVANTTTFKNARKMFASEFEGKYTIEIHNKFMDKSFNVRL